MYRPTLGADGIMDMLEAVPVKFARELYRRLPPQGRKVYFQVRTCPFAAAELGPERRGHACLPAGISVCMCMCVYVCAGSGMCVLVVKGS